MNDDDDDSKMTTLSAIDPDDLSTWPKPDVLGLNESQFMAFQAALTKEFAVIQGPPGTGKTYVGLKIAQALHANRKLWVDDEDEVSPILMVAYTNHALDQFLEGLYKEKDIQNIIRVGGRSKNEVLKPFNLYELRRTDKIGSDFTRRRRLRELKWKLTECNKDLQRYAMLHSQSSKGILSARSFECIPNAETELPFISDILREEYDEAMYMLQFLGVRKKPESPMHEGLTEGNYDVEEDEDGEGHLSAGHFMDLEERKENESKYEKFVICFANETTEPEQLSRELKPSDTDEELNLFHEIELGWLHGWGATDLNKQERWHLYRFWLKRLHDVLDEKIRKAQEEHLQLSNEQEDLQNLEDLHILRSADVVGMTTTGASKNHNLLRQLRPRIVIIEEAAEVFEGHAVSCLTEHCQHLILIGDHEQLRPNPSVYRLSVKFGLSVSLFERMVKSGVPHNCLSIQHRMRPNISRMLHHIYTDLEDDASVTKYEDVKGVQKNLFFVDHQEKEGARHNIHSKTNTHEAKFLVAFSYYLLRQGYHCSQITILTTYTGQMFEIRDLWKAKNEKWMFDDIPRICTVDNYQGEENDIILLSLVRNNEEENIGFLKTSNRVCVALSRARKGLYMFGNKIILAKQSPLWKSVIDDFEKDGCIGQHLPLVCTNHKTENLVASDKDFDEYVPSGGCLKPCSFRLPCGHACPQACHGDGHDSFRCSKPCQRPPQRCQLQNHKCTKLCSEVCDDLCQIPVEKTLVCGHIAFVYCGKDVLMADCKQPCEKILNCGHRCQSYCGKPCTTECQELVKTSDWSCGHVNTMACSATEKDCRVPCGTVLQCGHTCSGKCGECIQGRVHIKCKEKCERSLICSHLCKSPCTKNCPPCAMKCMRECMHSQCNHLCGKLCIPCKEPCLWKCDHIRCRKLCSEVCDRPRCNKPCNKVLRCSEVDNQQHFCRGLCGERCICVICDKNNDDQSITEIFFGNEDEEGARFIKLDDCKHIFEYTAFDQWMDSKVAGDEIKLKTCPLCNVPVQNTLRYGTVVKEIYRDIDVVKSKLLNQGPDVEDRKAAIKVLISEIMLDHERLRNEALFPVKQVKLPAKERLDVIGYEDILCLESQMRLMKHWMALMKKYVSTMKDSRDVRKSITHQKFTSEMRHLHSRIMVSPKQSTDVLEALRLELERMSLKRDVLVLKHDVSVLDLTLTDAQQDVLRNIMKKLENKEVIEEEIVEAHRNEIGNIYLQYPCLAPITLEEKTEIVKAIGLKRGHWFKCPNGHPYAIGECGGAMERSQCPECGDSIGGEQHRLVEGNEVATEMDGARYGAWSEQANLHNYQL